MINLFYPASYLPHKNHSILASPSVYAVLAEVNASIYLTIDQGDITFFSPNISLLGRLPRSSCIEYLYASSALLFLSSFESLGLPIIEAAEAKKPIVCLDRPYSRELLGDSAYYYPENSPESLAIVIKKFASECDSPRCSMLMQPKLDIATTWDILAAVAAQPSDKY
jgi:glycosyltransferase involved in cell wall biosynthesis